MIIDILIAAFTLALGLLGLFAPRYVASALDLAPTNSTMGLSELRAGQGGLFVAVSAWCLITGDSAAYAALGVIYLGAGTGRLLSILLDRPPLAKATLFWAFEWGPSIYLIYKHSQSVIY